MLDAVATPKGQRPLGHSGTPEGIAGREMSCSVDASMSVSAGEADSIVRYFRGIKELKDQQYLRRGRFGPRFCPSRATKRRSVRSGVSCSRFLLRVVFPRHLVYSDCRVICKLHQKPCNFVADDEAHIHQQFHTLRCRHFHKEADLLLVKRRSLGAIELQHVSWRNFNKEMCCGSIGTSILQVEINT